MNLIEDKLKRAINQAPYLDVEKLLQEPVRKMEAHDYITRQELPKSSTMRRLSPVYGLCACLIFAVISYFYVFTVPYGHIAIDINPSFQLTMNRLSSVITLEALNDDGEDILEAADIKDKDIKATLVAILDTMMKEGYLSSKDNAILVSVDNKSSKKANAILEEVDLIIKDYLSSHSITSELKEKIITDDAEKKTTAKVHGMSAGKLELIYDIMEDNPSLSFDYLSGLSLKELILLEEKYDDLEDELEDYDDDYEDDEDHDDDRDNDEAYDEDEDNDHSDDEDNEYDDDKDDDDDEDDEGNDSEDDEDD
ncbi:anti-sigma-I factor RsgI family protein [Alloiococcus sp. CFN-8]|uniref:anti-sigma-I factor RsgI family protein n=1 Tax=Alloiococcus sp. CFN-8 TaxID=3416081 RepID=UPI003CF8BFA4